ncbi:hypothetical protein E5288_WYG020544 [Bos mutus]|uniref:Uncharacterized protein n=1 Tax=Bos mutus TaxID=72004 RepID=A0A6B0RI61_9CETA|nr:hypothetical protein [Bos mutus]
MWGSLYDDLKGLCLVWIRLDLCVGLLGALCWISVGSVQHESLSLNSPAVRGRFAFDCLLALGCGCFRRRKGWVILKLVKPQEKEPQSTQKASNGTKGKKQEQQEKWSFERFNCKVMPAHFAYRYLGRFPDKGSFDQELLEILITKRVELKFWKEKEKEEEAGYHLNTLGKRIESLGHKQDTLGHQHFCNIKGKHEQLLGPEKPRYPDTLEDCLQKTCSQLFWGLPFLHIQNKATSFSSNAIENLESHFWKKQLERERTLPSLVKNSQQVFSQVTPNLSQETRSSQAHSSDSILPGYLISPEVREKLEHHIAQRFMQQQSGLPYRIQASQKLMQPQDQYPRPCQAQGREGPSRSSAGLGKRRQDAQKMTSKCPAQIIPGTDLRHDVGQSVGKIVKDLYMFSANPPVKDPRAKPESERVLSPDKKHPEVSSVLTERKEEQICEREIPVKVYHSRLADNLVFDILGETNAPMKTESTQSSQDGKASMITSHESLVLSPYTEQELEAHIIRFRATEKTWGYLRGPTPGDTHKPSDVPLTGQENKPSSLAPKYNFVSRMWHSESVVETEKGSLKPSPGSAMARNEPQEKTKRQASPESCSNVTVVDLDECSPSSRAQEVVEGDSAGKGTREPSVQVKSLDINMDFRRSWSPRSNKSPSLNTKSVASNTDLLFETQFLKLESQGFTDQQDQAQGQASSVLLQDCETGVLLQDCATDTLLKDCHSNMFLAANILASQESLSYYQTLSSEDKSNSQKLYDATSSEGSSQGQQVDMRRQLRYKSQGKKSVPKDGREKYTRPKLRQIKKGLAERRAYQPQGMSHPGQKKESTESLRSKFRQLILKKRQVPSESHFKERIKLLLQWIFPNKCKEPEEPLQKGKPETATVKSQESIKSKSTTESRAVEAQTVMTAVGQILKEKMVFHHGPHATELNWKSKAPENYRVPLGSTQLYQHTPQTREGSVSQIIMHPDFEKLHPFGSDLAMLQLLFPVNFTSYIIPACLPVPGMKLPKATESLIKAVYTLYQQRGLLIPVRTLLLKFFSKIYQKEELRAYRIRYRSKVLSRWLAGLPLQLAHLSSRNPELSTQLIDIIHTAAARANKELLKSLKVTALQIYDPQEGTVVVLPAESQQLLVQLVYFLPSLPADLLSQLSRCCIMGRLSANLAAMLIGILHMRSSFSGWKSSVKEQNGSVQLNISNADYFSFLFSTLTGFSKEELTWLQSLRGVPHVIQTQLSPVLLYLTDLDQFLHHWDVTETVCHSLLVVPVRSQSFDALQTAISKHLVGLTVIPDSTAGCVLGVICKLLDHTCVLSEILLLFLASCCYSLLYFLLTLEKGEAEHLRKSKLQSHQMEPCDQCGLQLTPQPPSAFHASTQEFLNFLNGQANLFNWGTQLEKGIVMASTWFGNQFTGFVGLIEMRNIPTYPEGDPFGTYIREMGKT